MPLAKIIALIRKNRAVRVAGQGSQGAHSTHPAQGSGTPPREHPGARLPSAVPCVTGGRVTPARVSHSSGGDRADVTCHNTMCLQGPKGFFFFNVSVRLSPRYTGRGKAGCCSSVGLMPAGGGGTDPPSPSVPGTLPRGPGSPCLEGCRPGNAAQTHCKLPWQPARTPAQGASSCQGPLCHVLPHRCASEPAPALPGERGRGRGRCPSC